MIKDNVIPFPSTTPRLNRAEEEAEKQRKEEEHGSIAWQQLSSRRNPRLAPEDRIPIARNLDREIQKLRLDKYEVARVAGIADPYRELYRLLLPDGTDPTKRQLRATKDKYARLTEATAKLAKQDRNRLAERITYGTSLHPSGAKDLSREEALYSLLLRIIHEVDEDFQLLDRYRALSAVLKEEASQASSYVEEGVPSPEMEGAFRVEDWRNFTPYFPHVWLGYGDYFDGCDDGSLDQIWPVPGEIEEAIRAYLACGPDKAAEYDWESAHNAGLARLLLEEPVWRRELSTLVGKHLPNSLEVVWDESTANPQPRLRSGGILPRLDTGKRAIRREYWLRLYDALLQRGVRIPDEIFEYPDPGFPPSEGLRIFDRWPMLAMVVEWCAREQQPLPPLAQRYLDVELEAKQKDPSNHLDWLTQYLNYLPVTPRWFIIGLDAKTGTLLPCLVGLLEDYWGRISADLDIDGPRALAELAGYKYAWPMTSYLDRLEELAANGEIERQWRQSAGHIRHHPKFAVVERRQRIRELLARPRREAVNKDG